MTPSQSSIEGRCIHHGLRASGLEAASPIERFTTGGFLPVMSDKLQFVDGATNVNRVLLCNGKVYYDLLAERK